MTRRPLAAIILLSSACASPVKYNVTVDARSRAEASEGGCYVLVPGDEDVSPTSLEFLEYRAYVDEALGRKGFQRIESMDDAEIVVTFSYGIGDAETVEWNSVVPQYGQTGLSSKNVQGNFNPWTGGYSETTTYTPSYGITGYRSVRNSATLFPRHCGLGAYSRESVERGEPDEQWQVFVHSRG